MKPIGQRDMMRRLVVKCGRSEEAVCREYASAEIRGEVSRKKNGSGLTPEEYARALWRDGERKGWL